MVLFALAGSLSGTASAQLRFSLPFPVIQVAPVGGASSPTLRDDELEMFFESSGDIHCATRPLRTVQFIESFRVDELSTIGFVEESPRISTDGLRIYFTRRPTGGARTREIFCAARTTLNAPFGTAVSLGPNGTEPFVGMLGSLTGEELKAYMEIFRTVPPGSGTNLTEQTDMASSTRSSAAQKFGPWAYLPNVNTLDYERDPFVYRDDRTLVFMRTGPISGLPGWIFSSSRPSLDVPFPAATAVLGINSLSVVTEDPYVIYPGSRIYFRQAGNLRAADRILSANYSLPQISGQAGRTVLYPIRVSTMETDAVEFQFRLVYDSFFLEWTGVIPGGLLDGEVVSAVLEVPGRIAVTVRGTQPIPGDGGDYDVALVQFRIADNAPVGQNRQLLFSGDPLVNQIPVARPAAGRITFLAPSGHEPTSLLHLR